MKSKMLLTSLNEVNDEYVEDADTAVASVKRFGWVRWAAVAACVLIAVLIAVPALKGKTPEVEPQPNELATVEKPIVEPLDEPDVEPADEPINEPLDGPMQGGASESTEDYTLESDTQQYKVFTSYNEFSSLIEDPVFEAFANSEEGQKHTLAFVVRAPGINKEDFSGSFAHVQILVDGIPMENSAAMSWLGGSSEIPGWDTDDSTVKIMHQFNTFGVMPDWNDNFVKAESAGVLTTFEVDGIEIQKYFVIGTNPEMPNRPLYERLSINDDWYCLYGRDEAKVDAIASALARIAATM